MLTGLPLRLIGYGLGALAIIAALLTINGWRVDAADRKAKLEVVCQATRDASNLPKLACKETAAQIRFLGEALNAVRTKTAQAKIDDAKHAAEVEAKQNEASKESSNDYQAELARVRAEYDRLRAAARRTDQGGGRNPPVSGAPASAGGSDAGAEEARLPSPDALTATEQAIQLKAFQDWARKVGLAR